MGHAGAIIARGWGHGGRKIRGIGNGRYKDHKKPGRTRQDRHGTREESV